MVALNFVAVMYEEIGVDHGGCLMTCPLRTSTHLPQMMELPHC